MGDDFITINIHGPVLEAVLTRPEKYNAITPAMLDTIMTAGETLASRKDLRVLLIHATGKYFSAGADVSGGMTPDFAGSTVEARRWYRAGFSRVHEFFESIEKPIVVAHQGPCLGGALEMSLSCDFRLASQSARYGLPEIDFGVLPGSGGTSRLTRLVGPHWARWLIMTGKQISAQQALAMGLIHEVYPDEGFVQSARAFCTELAAKPPEAIGTAKLTIELAADLEQAQARNLERLANSMLFMGEEHHDRVQAVLARMQSRKAR